MGDIRTTGQFTPAHGLTLNTRLREALDEEQFVLHYQPKIDLASGAVCGLEALMRWQDPRCGLVAPSTFIPQLEDTDLMVEVGHWAIRHALSQRLAWHIAGLRPPRIAVNVSAIQLRQPEFVSTICDSLEAVGVGPAGLELEFTESALLEDVDGYREKLRDVGERGVKIAVDDCGTDHAGLEQLARLPLSELKVDRPHIARMATGPDDLATVSTLISLAHSLDLSVVAEGVETGEQLDLLRSLNCDRIQGHIVSRPLPAAEVPRLLVGQQRMQQIMN